jgi:hypothetical protein
MHVLAARIIAVEHLLALLLILQLLFFLWWQKYNRKKVRRLLIGCMMTIAFVAPLLKLSGLVISLLPIILFSSIGKYRFAIMSGLATLAGIAVYVGYGYYYDFELFTAIQSAHTLRPQTFWYFYTLFDRPNLGNYVLEDPLFVMGVIGSFVAFWMHQKAKQKYGANILLIPWLLCMCIFLAVAPVELYGWYKFITIPLVAIGGGYIVRAFISGKLPTAFLVIPTTLMLWQQVSAFYPDVSILNKPMLIVLAGSGLLFAALSNLPDRLYKTWAYTITFLLLLFSGLWSLHLVLWV